MFCFVWRFPCEITRKWCRQARYSRIQSIRDDTQCIVGEDAWYCCLVVLYLSICFVKSCWFIQSIFEFYHDEWETVDIDDDIKSLFVIILFDHELVDYSEGIVIDVVEIEKFDIDTFGLSIPTWTVGRFKILYRHSISEHGVELLIVRHQVRWSQVHDLLVGFVSRRLWEIRIESGEWCTEFRFHDDTIKTLPSRQAGLLWSSRSLSTV